MKKIILSISCLVIALGGFIGCQNKEKIVGDDTEQQTYTFKRGVNINHWLAQNYDEFTYAAEWFGSDDLEWIAEHKFDHIRIPIDYKLWFDDNGELIEERVAPFDAACEWAVENGLGVILDMHYLPGASFTQVQDALFTDVVLMEKAANLWRKVATRYADKGPWLRFELINEPVAKENEHLNTLLAKLISAVRESNPTRVIYITSNRWGKFYTVPDLFIPEDENIALTLHFYDPFPFTHQSTQWTPFKPGMEQIAFPSMSPDLGKYIDRDHSWMRFSETELSAEKSIDPPFAELAAWLQENAPHIEVHIGEFGAFNTAPPGSVYNWNAAVVEAAERHGFGWCVWGYIGGFGVRDSAGESTPVHTGLNTKLGASMSE